MIFFSASSFFLSLDLFNSRSVCEQTTLPPHCVHKSFRLHFSSVYIMHARVDRVMRSTQQQQQLRKLLLFSAVDITYRCMHTFICGSVCITKSRCYIHLRLKFISFQCVYDFSILNKRKISSCYVKRAYYHASMAFRMRQPWHQIQWLRQNIHNKYRLFCVWMLDFPNGNEKQASNCNKKMQYNMHTMRAICNTLTNIEPYSPAFV